MSAFPLLVFGGALLLLGGKKKKKTTPTNGAEQDGPMDGDDDAADTGDGPEVEDEEEYGKVARGLRKDHIGSHAWRINYEEDGYHAQLMMNASNSSPMSEEIGVAASLRTAKELLRDHFNQALLDAGRTEADFREDPVPFVEARLITL
jgi:hypothetical protein